MIEETTAMPRPYVRKNQPAVRVPGEPEPTLPDVDDMGDIESETLPAVDPVQAELAELRAQVSRLARRAQVPQAEAAKEADPGRSAVSQDEARVMAEADVRRGVRPRPILTPDGWYVHPEMARSPSSVTSVKPAG